MIGRLPVCQRGTLWSPWKPWGRHTTASQTTIAWVELSRPLRGEYRMRSPRPWRGPPRFSILCVLFTRYLNIRSY